MWQDVILFRTNAVYFGSTPLVLTNPSAKSVSVETEVEFKDETKEAHLTATVTKFGDDKVLASKDGTARKGERVKMEIALPDVKLWDLDAPNLYILKLTLADSKGNVLDTQAHRFGFRTFETKERQFIFNCRPIYPRGILHWGYYPELISPVPDEKTIRKEILDMKSLGYNMIKVCLFFFPQRFYDIADELGMLVWQEYPVWIKPMKKDNLKQLREEYTEFYLLDRNRTCVVLRDLTCENGQAEHDVLKELYDLGKRLIPGAIIEDSSDVPLTNHGNRADFYDCHPYVDNDEFLYWLGIWSSSLQDLVKKYGLAPQPFILGESIDSDTFRSLEWLEKKAGNERHWWLPWYYDDQKKFREKILSERGREAWEALIPNSHAHALVTRKFQIEAFRHAPETSGYTITSIRDIRLTSPGMYTHSGDLKWRPEDWLPFNSDTVVLLSTPQNQFVFRADEEFKLQLNVSHYGPKAISNGSLAWGLEPLKKYKDAFSKIEFSPTKRLEGGILLKQGALEQVAVIPLVARGVERGVAFKLTVKLKENAQVIAENSWPLWVIPAGKVGKGVALYNTKGTEISVGTKFTSMDKLPEGTQVLVTDSLTSDVVNYLKSGLNVVHIVPKEGKWPRIGMPFWRETVAIMPAHPALGDFPCDEVIDLQFMSMTQRNMLDVNKFREKVSSVVEVVNCRNMARGTLVFECKVGKGVLIVTAFPHGGKANVAGHYLLEQFVEYLKGNPKPVKELSPDALKPYLDK
jgi:hypothetical protein